MQRRLTGLGFDTKVTGTFDEATRAVITRWQAARGYPKSGYLNKLQHKALLTEIVATAPTASSSDEERSLPRRATQRRQAAAAAPSRPSRRSGSMQRRSRSAGAGRFIGGVVGGMLALSADRTAPIDKKPGSSPGFFISLRTFA